MKTNGTRRVLVPVNGEINKAIALAIKLGIELAAKVADDIDGVVLYLANKKSILESSLEEVVSPKIAKLLHMGQHVPMGKGLGFRAETAKTFKSGSQRDIVIAVNTDDKMMAKVDKMTGLHTVIAVPKAKGALDKWKETWSPLIPGAKKKVTKSIIDPVVKDALSALAVSIDLSVHGLAQPDKRQVENMIRLLKQNKRLEKPANIRAWAVKNGWPDKTADELVKIWEEVYGLQKASKPKVKNCVPVLKPDGGGLPKTIGLPKDPNSALSLAKRSPSKGGESRSILITP